MSIVSNQIAEHATRQFVLNALEPTICIKELVCKHVQQLQFWQLTMESENAQPVWSDV